MDVGWKRRDVFCFVGVCVCVCVCVCDFLQLSILKGNTMFYSKRVTFGVQSIVIFLKCMTKRTSMYILSIVLLYTVLDEKENERNYF